jgi:hypothetical protein
MTVAHAGRGGRDSVCNVIVREEYVQFLEFGTTC